MLSRHRERRKPINNSIPNKPSRSLIEEVKPRRDITDSVIAEKASRQVLSYQQQNRSDATEEDLYAAEIAKQLKPKDLAYAYYKNVPFKDLKKVYKDELKSGRRVIEGEHKRETKPSVTFEDVSDLHSGSDDEPHNLLLPGEEEEPHKNLSEYQNPFEDDSQHSDYEGVVDDDNPNWEDDDDEKDDTYVYDVKLKILSSYLDSDNITQSVEYWKYLNSNEKDHILAKMKMKKSFPMTKSGKYSTDSKKIKAWIERADYATNLSNAIKEDKNKWRQQYELDEINGSGLKGILKGKGILNNKKPSTRGRKKIPDIDVHKEFLKARGEIIDGNDGDQVKKIARDCLQILYYKGKLTASDVKAFKKELEL